MRVDLRCFTNNVCTSAHLSAAENVSCVYTRLHIDNTRTYNMCSTVALKTNTLHTYINRPFKTVLLLSSFLHKYNSMFHTIINAQICDLMILSFMSTNAYIARYQQNLIKQFQLFALGFVVGGRMRMCNLTCIHDIMPYNNRHASS